MLEVTNFVSHFVGGKIPGYIAFQYLPSGPNSEQSDMLKSK